MEQRPADSQPEDSSEALLNEAFKDDPGSQLRLMALDDLRLRLNLFLCGTITAEETGHPGCSYAPDGTPCITDEVAKELGMMVLPFNDDEED